MIHFFALIPRIQGVSSQEFHDHWRHPHGTMGRHSPTLRSYVQAHQIHTDLLGSEQAEFEGIAESTFDTLTDALAFGDEPYYTRHIKPDEPNFVDQSRLLWFNTTEEVLVPRLNEQNGASYADCPVATSRSISINPALAVHSTRWEPAVGCQRRR